MDHRKLRPRRRPAPEFRNTAGEDARPGEMSPCFRADCAPGTNGATAAIGATMPDSPLAGPALVAKKASEGQQPPSGQFGVPAEFLQTRVQLAVACRQPVHFGVNVRDGEGGDKLHL